MRLLPLPESIKTVLVTFADLKDAAKTVSDIIKAKIIPSTLEIMDSVSIRCVEEFSLAGLPDADAVLLIEVDGSPEATGKEAGKIEKICLENNALEVRAASEKKEVKDLWNARRAISASLFRIKPNKINEDIVVPRASIPELISGVQEIGKIRGLLIASFGHAGDGNIHVNVMYDKKDPKEAEAAQSAVREIFALTLRLKGTISGEHGVGITKTGYLDMELSPPAIEAMKRIKNALDPKGILNPGKIFPESAKPN